MYGGQDYNKTQFDNALQSRNQVGSSFKPYVLATAVKQGMNVQTSHLNGFSPLWIPPDSQPATFAGIKNPGIASDYEVQNDEVSNPDRAVSVVEATAMSLNTAYADLWHRVAFDSASGKYPVVQMARAFGVNTTSSGLRKMHYQAGTALGQASLTVEEQANMMATLAAGGQYAKPHVIKRIINGNSIVRAQSDHRQVLTPDEAAEVDYAMSFDMESIGTANGLGLTNGQTVIAKTGTTNLSQSAFFMGATPKEAMAVGLFVSHPGCTLPASEQSFCTSTSAIAFQPPAGLETLFGVGGLSGYGGQYPALIWHDFFMDRFNNQAPVAFPPVNGDGAKLNLMGQLPKPKQKTKPDQQGGGGGPGCGHGHHRSGLGPCGHNPGPTPTVGPSSSPTPSPSPTSSPTHHPGISARDAAPGRTGAGAGVFALAAVVIAGPSLSV